MQAVAIAAMAVHAILATTPSHHETLLFATPTNPSNPPVFLHSSFRGVSLKLPPQSLPVAAATVSNSKKPLLVSAATKKAAVAALKGNSKVEGVVKLTQEDDGLFSFLCFYLLF